jgi:hypothetical protein
MTPSPRHRVAISGRSRRSAAAGMLLTLLVLGGSPAGQSVTITTNRASGNGIDVTITRVVKLRVRDNEIAYVVGFDYSFPAPVLIKGLGVVPARGSFEYVSPGITLEFLDPATGRVLAAVPLAETTVVAAGAPLDEIPRESEFPSGVREFPWNSPQPLLARVNSVLRTHFQYQPYQRDGITYVATTYADVPLDRTKVQQGSLARLSLLITFLHQDGNAATFRLRSLVKEGRSHSPDWRPTDAPTIRSAADQFVDRLVQSLTAGAK